MPDKPPAARRGRPLDLDARQRCLELAAGALQERGYAGLTMNELARQAGVSKKSLYTWWPNKAAIVVEALVAMAEMPPLPDLGNTEAELRALFAIIRRTASTSELPLAVTALNDPASRTAVSRTYIERLVGARRELSRALVQRGVDRGDLPAGTDIDTLLDMWNGLAAYRLLRGVALPDHVVDQLIVMALNGNVPLLP
ncbi:TetR/AcrR family transcriptional regulator [Streptomyces sp. NPDC002514]|uniref:TetR/AcrR family transcriptional regulator n=1 Tax=Streptomyces sp. NPDC001270 TaxID=3364554 RepID=UPI0036CBB6A4